MEDSVASNAARQKVLVDLAAASLERQGLAHAFSIAITTKLFLPGRARLRKRFLQRLPCKLYGTPTKERRCHQ